MKVLPFKIPKPDFGNLLYQVDKGTAFYDKLHQHEEIQVSFILEGEGTLVVGDTVNYFNKNTLIVIGSNLPHVFKTDVGITRNVHMLTLFFTASSFGSKFFDLDELKDLQAFFRRAKRGFQISSKPDPVKKLFLELERASKFNRFLILLQILKLSAKAPYVALSDYSYDKKYSDVEGHRMRNVFEYTMNHYDRDIHLDTISNVANMTKNAFCKYFKKRTNKTYVQFLNELRISKACQQLIAEKDKAIADIAQEVGFNNLSNFNRQFKAFKQCRPSAYRNSI
ncbi:AraC family transcriptional regulator [Gaetbulibacter aestuarii]|uniref:AraC family transcriptional regulator n=1 Tax=Gaetbulibacter aestuarii TaxID=1502358 RepID=A0ABW7MW61_9FLAO